MCRQRYQEGFLLEEEAMFLFLTYLAHQVQAPLRSSTFVAESPRRRSTANISAPIVANKGVKPTSKKLIKLPTTLPSAEIMKSDVRALADYATRMEEFFSRMCSTKDVESQNIKTFFKSVKPVYNENILNNSIELRWLNVCKRIVEKKFPKNIPTTLTVRWVIIPILEAHGLKCPIIEDPATLSSTKTIRPLVEPTISKYVGDAEFKFKSGSRFFLIFAYLAFYAPQLTKESSMRLKDVLVNPPSIPNVREPHPMYSFVQERLMGVPSSPSPSADAIELQQTYTFIAKRLTSVPINSSRTTFVSVPLHYVLINRLDLEEAADEKGTKGFDLSANFLDYETLKSDVITLLLDSAEFEEFFNKNVSLETIESQTIKSFMEYVEPYYKKFSEKSDEVESIWKNVCKKLVSMKLLNENPSRFTFLTAVETILNDHNLNFPEFKQVKDVTRVRPVVEKIIQIFLSDPIFELKNDARTFLILAYMAYYSPGIPSHPS